MSKKLPYSDYAKYTAIAFQYVAVFILLSLGGNYLDEHYDFGFPYFTLAGVFLGLVFIFYSVYKLISKND